jgi:glycogen debranching enzyme
LGVPELRLDYQAEHQYEHQGDRGTVSLHRALLLRIRAPEPPSCSLSDQPDAAAKQGACTLRFRVELPAQASWHASVQLIPELDGQALAPQDRAPCFFTCCDEQDQRQKRFLAEATAFSSAESSSLAPMVVSALERAKHDLAALRLYDLDHGEHAWLPAAGLPLYIALFGRDTLMAAWQAGLLSAEMMRGTLLELPRWQGARGDDWRDEQPGRMLHEAHTGPLEVLNYNPRQRYYGEVTASSLYSIVLGQLWRWTADEALIRPLIGPALRALEWLDQYADLDGDGFYEYLTRSQQGVKNQGWRDSGDAIVHADGTQVQPPIALCEEQCLAYAAKRHLGEVLGGLGETGLAARLRRQAEELKQRFQPAFWMPDQGYVALGLDAQKRQIRSVGSQGCECLQSGIVDDSAAASIARRLAADDLFTGWGIRTLSASHPAFDPYSYHRGSVWPFQHGGCALGLWRYGLREQVSALCQAQFEAATLFEYHRLPEVFSGHQRDATHPFPALYPKANAPQAWSASVLFCFVAALLGLYPHAPRQLLLIDPSLPSWLPELTLHNLRVGLASVTIRFFRKPDGSTGHQVLHQQGPLRILQQPCPWSLDLSALSG